MKSNNFFNLIQSYIKPMARSFEDGEIATGVDAVDAVDPLPECFLWDRDGGLGEDVVVVIGLDKPLNMAFGDVFRDGVELISVTGLARSDEVEDVVRAAGAFWEIVIHAETSHFEGLTAEKAVAVLAIINVVAVYGDIFSRGHGAPALFGICERPQRATAFEVICRVRRMSLCVAWLEGGVVLNSRDDGVALSVDEEG
ncbi:hypothetical protein SAMN03080599_03014 [Acidaminobacter hydrogenoformans DSM 2784]|uniref:Uncharacterized protein n=1 Tax=Acidaminobacter hydrogenoformans DSM 2784 TaxID=1120920 RepID=A0A1G5S629_9FIRM|nr:hypothetical protein SAMN03080599_03014 [Acidaminobacter hydrogenoformans DSM 2784]